MVKATGIPVRHSRSKLIYDVCLLLLPSSHFRNTGKYFQLSFFQGLALHLQSNNIPKV